MIGQATAHRRANAFAQALETAGFPGKDPRNSDSAPQEPTGEHGAHATDRHADPDQGRLLALVGAIGNRQPPVLSAEAKTVQRAQLIAAMETALADGSLEVSPKVPEQRTGGAHRATGLGKLRPRSRWSRRLAAGGLSVGVAAGALGGVAAASTNALPGDTLYGLKRGMEDLKLDMANNDASRGSVYLDMAATRMQEARRLMERGRSGELDSESVGEVRRALSGMHQEAAEGHRLLTEAYQRDGSLQPMELLNEFNASHREGWSQLRDRLPSQLGDVSSQVTSVFDAIEHDVAPLAGKLPKPQGSEGPAHRQAGKPGSVGTGHSGTATPAPHAPATAEGHSGTPGTTDSPSAGAGKDHLLGGTDGLLPPSPGTGGENPSDPAASTPPSVNLPPLLPGLLPGLGLGAEDAKE
ncbi:hypothetical protein G3I60_22720 [Streptomyces sp. SID13666]|uniref:DUF5667 domain-containing protein n=1 Tax=Streptomyces TaxID=1883 RepID=UPI001105A2C0|nr:MULTISPECIES: DUF5667 domain-containing protein [Streptomyces]MCZ4097115.1 DUF5667 domain-containing protein [Streptomyces sp. H39-C1]NEA56874.1 hypothetical protein [Streptomyces sp. SID13666]NEA75702.1 hypothetical protein [Streptomyces sp. SID13588]QNA74656.1 hypothetical protein C8250_024650 [Streptomyces sp. So13.3]